MKILHLLLVFYLLSKDIRFYSNIIWLHSKKNICSIIYQCYNLLIIILINKWILKVVFVIQIYISTWTLLRFRRSGQFSVQSRSDVFDDLN